MVLPQRFRTPLSRRIAFWGLVACFPSTTTLFSGQISPQYRSTTARMAPSWMTTRKVSQNSGETFILTNSSRRIMCPVLLTGSHSVIPSTTPKSTAFRISNIYYLISAISLKIKIRRVQYRVRPCIPYWCARRDSNSRPSHSECATLSPELRALGVIHKSLSVVYQIL